MSIETRTKPTPELTRKQKLMRRLIVPIAVAAGLGVGNHLYSDGPEEEDVTPISSTEYLDDAVDAAQDPYNSETDSKIVSNITPDSENPTASEAVQNNEQVKDFMKNNPDEVPSIIASSNSLGNVTYSIDLVGRDIDGDGDKDAVAVPSEKQ